MAYRIEKKVLENLLKKEYLYNLLMDYGLLNTVIWEEIAAEFDHKDFEQEVKFKLRRYEEVEPHDVS